MRAGGWLPPGAPATEADQPPGQFDVTGLGRFPSYVDVAPQDALARAITAGDWIEVESPSGSLRARARVTPLVSTDNPFYLDVEYRLPSVALLDYDPILDDAQEFTLSGSGFIAGNRGRL